MARVGASKKKKNPGATDLRQLKKELKRVTEQLESRDRELAEASERKIATSDILALSPACPMTCSRYWKWWQRTRRDCVARRRPHLPY